MSDSGLRRKREEKAEAILEEMMAEYFQKISSDRLKDL